MPFFVRLRSALKDQASIPSDGALIISGRFGRNSGADWIENLSSEYRPLIVLDGWDELRAADRGLAAAWLMSLCQRFPSGHVIVTTREDGARDPVFVELGFSRTTLALLGQDQKRELISKWFKGLKENLLQSPDQDELNLLDAEASLLRDVRGPILSELTDTPLVTAMLCCLYATSTARNPLNKNVFYQRVTTTLIHTRDEDRGVHTGVAIQPE